MISQPHPISDTSPDSAGSDVLVIGGGVIGLAIAWRAAQRGMRVALADPEPGRGASHAAAGMLTPVAEAAYAERELFELGSLSLRRYPEFAAELADMTGRQVGYRQTGTLQVAYDADDMAMLDEHALLRESFGAPPQPADRPRVPSGRAAARPGDPRRPAGRRRRFGRSPAAHRRAARGRALGGSHAPAVPGGQR